MEGFWLKFTLTLQSKVNSQDLIVWHFVDFFFPLVGKQTNFKNRLTLFFNTHAYSLVLTLNRELLEPFRLCGNMTVRTASPRIAAPSRQRYEW